MSSRPEVHQDDYELCWVLQGRIRLSILERVEELGPGDVLQFDGVLEHAYEALEPTTLILVHLRKDLRF